MGTMKKSNFEERRIGWAILLVTVGVIWLLANVNVISTAGINIALSLWPLILIAIGANLLLQNQSPRLSTWIVLGIAVVVVLAALIAPRLGIGVLTTATDSYSERIGNAESATIDLHPSVGRVDVYALTGDDLLMSAEATYVGEVEFSVTGTTQRRVEFGQNEVSTTGWVNTNEELRWNIGLTPTIPLDVSINTGVSDANLDFADLTLTGLRLNGGVGRITLALPQQETAYQVTVKGGVGDFDVRIADNTAVDLTITGGVGDVDVTLPADAAVRVRVSSGLGNVNMPSWLERTDSGGDDQVWQSSGYNDAVQQINIDIQSGLGSLTIR